MPHVDSWVVLSFSALIFLIGLLGILIRRNILIMLMCIELMLNSVNLTLVVYGKELADLTGQMSVFFVMVVAAAEAAVGLGIVIAMFRTLKSVDTNELQFLRD